MKTKVIFLLIFLLSSQWIFAQTNPIDLRYEVKNDKSVAFYYDKNMPGTYIIEVEFTHLENSSDSRKYQVVVKESSGFLFTLHPYDNSRGVGFAYKYTTLRGNPKAKVNENIIYALPYKKGKKIQVLEASNVGEKYLGIEKPQNWKSFLVRTDTPDTIYAMRRGIVVELEDKYEKEDNSKYTYTSKRNSLIIEHPDGTYASYIGFEKGQFYVNLGQEVYPHTPLGKVDRFGDSYRLGFSVYHFLPNLMDREKITMKKRNTVAKFINPLFLINGESKTIKHMDKYEVDFNEDLKLQEFSKREKKRYKKHPEDFK